MTREEFKKLITVLLPEVEPVSRFLSPVPAFNIDAATVFDALRAATDPPVTEEEFNALADEIREGTEA
jgi:hypothetical protein